MRYKHEQNTTSDRRVGNIKDWPSGEVVSKNIQVKEICVDKVNHAAIEQGSLAKEDTIEHAINQIPNRTAKNHRKSDPERDVFIPGFVQIEKDPDTREDGKDRKKQLPAYIYAKSHARVFDICETQQIANDRTTCTQRKAVNVNSQERNLDPFDPQLGQLVGDDDKDTKVEYFHQTSSLFPRPQLALQALLCVGDCFKPFFFDKLTTYGAPTVFTFFNSD